MARNETEYDFVANDRFSTVMRKFDRDMRKVETRLGRTERSMRSFDATSRRTSRGGVFAPGFAKGMGKFATVAGAYAGARAVSGSIGAAATADEARRKVMTNLRTEEDREQWRDRVEAAIKQGQDMGYSAAEVGDGLFSMTSALGFTEESFAEFSKMLRAAKGGMAPLADMIFAASIAVKNHSELQGDTMRAVELMMEAQVDGMTTLTEIARAAPIASPMVAAGGGSFADYMAMLAQTTGSTQSTSVAATYIRAATKSLLKPEKSAVGFLRAGGLPTSEDELREKGWMESMFRIGDLRGKRQGRMLLQNAFRDTEAILLTQTLSEERLKAIAGTRWQMNDPTTLRLAIKDYETSLSKSIAVAGQDIERGKEGLGRIIAPTFQDLARSFREGVAGEKADGRKIEGMERWNHFVPTNISNWLNIGKGPDIRGFDWDAAKIVVEVQAEPGTKARVDESKTTTPRGVQTVVE